MTETDLRTDEEWSRIADDVFREEPAPLKRCRCPRCGQTHFRKGKREAVE